MIRKKIDPFAAPLDDEEKDLLESYERGEWKTVGNLEEEKAKANIIHKFAAGHLN